VTEVEIEKVTMVLGWFEIGIEDFFYEEGVQRAVRGIWRSDKART